MKFKLLLLFIITIVFFGFYSVTALATTSQISTFSAPPAVCQDPDVQNNPYCQTPDPTSGDPLATTIGKVTLLIAVFGAIIAVFFIIYGGFRYIVSGGNPEKIKTATTTILYSVIGLVVIAAAQSIIYFFIKYITKQ